MVSGAAAFAADGGPASGGGATSPDALADTHGVPVSAFTLDLNTGNRYNPLDAYKGIFSMVMQVGWELYKSTVAGLIWLMAWVLKLEWMQWIIAPLKPMAAVAQDAVDRIGLGPLMLTMLAFVVGIWWLRGRWAGGITELGLGLLVAALATGVMVNPLSTIAGSNGWIMAGRDAGVQVATAVATDGANMDGSNTTDYVNGFTGQMVDTLIRLPHQVLNYGQVIDGTGCEQTYTDHVGKDGARDALGGCNASLKAYADSPDATKVVAVFEPYPVVGSLTLLGLAVSIGLVLAVLFAGIQGVKLVWQLPIGILPGPGRGVLMKTLANAMTGVSMVAVMSVVVVGWMKVISSVMSSSSVLPWAMRVRVINFLLLVGVIVLIVVWWKVRKGWHKAADLAAKLGPHNNPVPKPVLLPGAMKAASTAHQVYSAHRMIKALRGTHNPPKLAPKSAPGRPPVDVGPIQSTPHGGGRGGTSGPGSAGSGRPGGRPPQIGPGSGSAAASQLRGRLGKATGAVVQVAAAAATGGGSAAATAAGKTVATTGAKVAGKAAATAGARAAGRSAATAVTANTSGAGARAAGQAAARGSRTARGARVRQQLRQARMRTTSRGAVDERTGLRYRRVRVNGVEVLTPETGDDPRS